jgi:hypothetical protein
MGNVLYEALIEYSCDGNKDYEGGKGEGVKVEGSKR